MELINYILSNPVAFFGALWFGLLPIFAYGIASFFTGGKYIEALFSLKVWPPIIVMLIAVSLSIFLGKIFPMWVYQYTGWFCITALVAGIAICSIDYFSDDSKFPRYYFSFGPMISAAIIYLPITIACISCHSIFNYLSVKFFGKLSEKEAIEEHARKASFQSETQKKLDEVIETERKNDALIALYNEVLRSTDNPEERKIIQDYLKTFYQ